MKKPIHPKKFLPTLTYEGGDKKLFQFITNHLKYPPEAIENKIEGTVIVKYEINYKGHITQTKVISGIGYGCDEEAERVVRLLEFKVSKSRDLKFKFYKTIQIHFKLPNTPIEQSIQTTYTYTIEPSKTTNEPPSYHYTINT